VGCWLLLASVELLPRLAALAQFSPVAAATASVWETAAGKAAVEWYEAVVFNPVADLDNLLLPLAASLLAVCTARYCRRCARATRRWRGRSAGSYRHVGGGDDEEEEEEDDLSGSRTPGRRSALRDEIAELRGQLSRLERASRPTSPGEVELLPRAA